jgi:hypothetical protein
LGFGFGLLVVAFGWTVGCHSDVTLDDGTDNQSIGKAGKKSDSGTASGGTGVSSGGSPSSGGASAGSGGSSGSTSGGTSGSAGTSAVGGSSGAAGTTGVDGSTTGLCAGKSCGDVCCELCAGPAPMACNAQGECVVAIDPVVCPSPMCTGKKCGDVCCETCAVPFPMACDANGQCVNASEPPKCPACVKNSDCGAGKICVAYVANIGPTSTTTTACKDNPCASDTLSCACAGSVCKDWGVGACFMNGEQVSCDDGRQ